MGKTYFPSKYQREFASNDGIYGGMTQKALVKFQQKYQLKDTSGKQTKESYEALLKMEKNGIIEPTPVFQVLSMNANSFPCYN